jgi:esterase/lipase superfamily enzyme
MQRAVTTSNHAPSPNRHIAMSRFLKIAILLCYLLSLIPATYSAETSEQLIYFATNRAKHGDFYGARRNYSQDDHDLIYGKCLTTSRGNKWKFNIPTPLTRDEFLKEVQSLYDSQPNNKEIIIFVHGYNQKFKQAIKCGAILSDDAKIPVVVFDWVSVGKLFGYNTDECNVEWSVRHFQLLMQSLVQHKECDGEVKGLFPAQAITTVSHSMGNRIVYWYLQSRYDNLYTKCAANIDRYKEVVLTSPDVDRMTFKSYFYKVAGNASKVRIYISGRDKPLRLSRFLHGGYGRVGSCDPETKQELRWELPGTIEGTETINFTDLDDKYIGHTIQSKLIADMHNNQTLSEDGLYLEEDPVARGYFIVRKK